MKKIILFIFVLISTITFSEFVYNSYVSPIPTEWVNNNQPEIYKVKLNFSPWVAFGNWNSNFVTNYPWGWGTPTNPAENVFYLYNEIPPLMNITFEFSKNGFTLFRM